MPSKSFGRFFPPLYRCCRFQNVGWRFPNKLSSENLKTRPHVATITTKQYGYVRVLIKANFSSIVHLYDIYITFKIVNIVYVLDSVPNT